MSGNRSGGSPARRRAQVAAAIAFWLSCGAGVADAAVLRVGADAACDFVAIQPALDLAAATPGADTIRVARNGNYLAQALRIVDDDDVSLIGGHDRCDQDGVDPSTRARLDGAGNGGDSVVRIEAGPAATVILRWLEIGNGTATTGRGGGLRIEGGRQVVLDTLRVIDNRADLGGAIYLGAPSAGAEVPQLALQGTSELSGNRARRGGAIHADGGTASVYNGSGAAHAATLRDNLADEYGGALSLAAGARWTMRSVRMIGNHATLDGGAFHLHNAALLYLMTSPQRGVELSDNRAERHGGAIHARVDEPGATTVIALEGDIRISAEAGASGAGIYLDGTGVAGGAAERIQFGWNDSLPLPHAHGPLPRNGIVASRAGDGSLPGALVHLASTDAFVTAALFNLFIEDNRAADVVRLEQVGAGAGGSRLLLTDSLVAENDVARIVRSDTGGSAALTRVTLAANTVDDVLFDHAGGLRLVDSILHQPGVPVLRGPSDPKSLEARNLLVHDAIALPLSPDTIVADPLFVDGDRNGGVDLRLRAGSPAIDFAPLDPSAPPRLDLDGTARGYDDPGHPDRAGPVDLGAYERFERQVFASGFESGQ